jgi:hypothetical protein
LNISSPGAIARKIDTAAGGSSVGAETGAVL